MSTAGDALRRRTLMILGAAAGVALLLGAASFIPPSDDLPRAEVGQKVLPAFESKAGLVSLIMVTTGEESYHLVLNPDGWVLAEKGSYAVAPAKIQELTEALSSMRYARAMTREDRKFDRIGLGDPGAGGSGALVEAGDGQGTKFATLLIGRRDGRTYVRHPDDLQAWAVEGTAMPPLQRAAWWLDLDIAPLDPEDIVSVRVTPVSGPAYGLERDADGEFTLTPPHDNRPVVAALGPGMVAQALSRLAPVDVAPVQEIATGQPVAEHVTRTRNGVAVVVRSWRARECGWVTVSAATVEDAPADAVAQAEAINAKAAPWAFCLTELDWGAYSTPLFDIAN